MDSSNDYLYHFIFYSFCYSDLDSKSIVQIGLAEKSLKIVEFPKCVLNDLSQKKPEGVTIYEIQLLYLGKQYCLHTNKH